MNAEKALAQFAMQESNKAIVRRLFEDVITEGRLEVIDEIFAPDFFWPQFGLSGPQGVRNWVLAFQVSFPGVVDVVEQQIADGDWVVTKVTVKGTNSAPFYGMPATGESAVFTAVGFDRLENGKIKERFAIFNMADLMRQLGHESLPLQKLGGPVK